MADRAGLRGARDSARGLRGAGQRLPPRVPRFPHPHLSMGARLGRCRPAQLFSFRGADETASSPSGVARGNGNEPFVRELRQPVQQPCRDAQFLQWRPDQCAARRGPQRPREHRGRCRGLLDRAARAFNVKLPVALTIAGSDSGGGAGIQADLKTFAALGVHGTSAITAITAQNTLGVGDILELPATRIDAQIEAIMLDIGAAAAKTGMLSSVEIIEVVASAIVRHNIRNLVVDPVRVAKGGARLLRDDAVDALRSLLLPLAAVVTPNLPEAEVLLGRSIRTLDDRRQAARDLVALGARAAVVKGGHADEELAIDHYFDGTELVELQSPRFATANTHGSGCVFSAAIAAEMAKGSDSLAAVHRAKEFITGAIERSLEVGRGHGPVNPMVELHV